MFSVGALNKRYAHGNSFPMPVLSGNNSFPMPVLSGKATIALQHEKKKRKLLPEPIDGIYLNISNGGGREERKVEKERHLWWLNLSGKYFRARSRTKQCSSENWTSNRRPSR